MIVKGVVVIAYVHPPTANQTPATFQISLSIENALKSETNDLVSPNSVVVFCKPIKIDITSHLQPIAAGNIICGVYIPSEW